MELLLLMIMEFVQFLLMDFQLLEKLKFFLHLLVYIINHINYGFHLFDSNSDRSEEYFDLYYYYFF